MISRAENWTLIQRLCEQAQDDSITSTRVALLNDFSKDPFRPDNHSHHLLACCKKLLFPGKTKHCPSAAAQRNLPLILFPYATGSNLLNLLPVAREAKKRGLVGLVVAGEGVDPELLAEFENVITEHELWRHARGQGVVRIFRAAREKFQKLVRLLEMLSPDCARRVLQNHGLYYRHLFVAEAMRRGFRNLLDEWRPSCVVSTSDYWPFECQLFCQAQLAGIPNAMIQHGEFSDVSAWPTQAETFLVWGSVFQEKLLKLGAPAERLRVCGMPSADALFNRFQNPQPKTVNADAPVCLFFSSAHDRFEDPATYASFARVFKNVIALLPRVQWQIRLHPAEDDSFYQELGLIGHPRVQFQPRNLSLEDAVMGADVVCTIRSTAGLQAMMMRRPLIVLDLTTGAECSVWWPSHGGGFAVNTAETFKLAFDRLVEDSGFRDSLLKSQQEFLDKSFANKGNAATAIVDYLAEQTKLRTSPPR